MNMRMKLTSIATGWLGALLLFTACGGGVGTGGTGSYTYGPITGFGSIIVSGVRFDDSAAQIEDDAGGARTRDELKLGMTVSIDSDAVASGQAKASVVRFGSVLAGPVTSVGDTTLVAVGQTVQVRSTTVFDDSLGTLASIAVGRMIEVHGYLDAASGTIIASRIEAASSSLASVKVRGVVGSLDAVARTLTIGQAVFDYSSALNVPTGLAAGQIVTLRAQTVQVAGRWVVTSFGLSSPSRPFGDRDQCDIRGVITSFTSTTSFVLNGVPVNASGASFPDGTAGVVAGARVKVEGSFAGGTLNATKVEIDSDDRLIGEGIDLRGAIESTNPGLTTFRLRGNAVFYGSPTVRFDNGSASDLAVGRQVRVRGVLSSDRTRVLATRIEFVS